MIYLNIAGYIEVPPDGVSHLLSEMDSLCGSGQLGIARRKEHFPVGEGAKRNYFPTNKPCFGQRKLSQCTLRSFDRISLGNNGNTRTILAEINVADDTALVELPAVTSFVRLCCTNGKWGKRSLME